MSQFVDLLVANASTASLSRIFRRIHKLPNFRPLFIQIRQVLRAELLIHGKLCLCSVLLAGVHVGLAQPVMRVREIRICSRAFTYSGMASAYLF